MSNPSPSRLQIAVRIQQLLLAELGHGIAVEDLLSQPRYARDVLLVCDAMPGTELRALSNAFRRASQSFTEVAEAPGHVRQPTEWARDTSGFGVSRPIGLDAAKAESTANWLKPTTWVRRAAPARNN